MATNNADLFIVIIGGPFPGVKNNWPHLAINTRAPPLPIAVQCRSAQEADTVNTIFNPLLKPYVSSVSRPEVALVFNGSTNLCSLPGPFYGVCFCKRPGVYTSWDMATTNMSGWNNPMPRKFNTLSGALVYLALKGRTDELEIIRAGSQDAATKPRARSASPTKIGRRHLGKNKAQEPILISSPDASDEEITAGFEYMGNFPAAVSSSRAPRLKKSASQPPVLSKPSPASGRVTGGQRGAIFPVNSSPPAEHSDHHIVSYQRTLSGITGIITDDSLVPEEPRALAQVIGHAAVNYLTAHGYTAASQQSIGQAYTQFHGREGFVGFLCGKGMARSEAGWLWDFVSAST